MTGYIHSHQSLGTLDGPGVRYIVFMQGCPLRCHCCHNPDTWEFGVGSCEESSEVFSRILRCKSYFGTNGGVTVSGGEPLMQADFVSELFDLCHSEGINTCLDTSGCVLDDSVKDLLDRTDYVLLDIKYTNDAMYRRYVGCGYSDVLKFLSYLNEKNITTRIRQVVISDINDNIENYSELLELVRIHNCIEGVELLPFKKLCSHKYDKLGIEFPFKGIPEGKGTNRYLSRDDIVCPDSFFEHNTADK
ncbi:MAG: pyruvate formate lyase-activating protein [Clostridia bacterium]|nr:pyruvate formate lyase-activating protein [Clostridia bacterium]